MTRPLVQIHDLQSGNEVVREMNDAEYAEWQAKIYTPLPTPTKEELLAKLQELQAQIQALG